MRVKNGVNGLIKRLLIKPKKEGLGILQGGLLGESERKNLSQMAENAIGVEYHQLHHFLTEAPWSSSQINERRLEVMSKCSQTRISRGFSLIIDDSGHRKSGNFTDGVGFCTSEKSAKQIME